MSGLERFLGDSLWRVVLKLVVASFVVGLAMNAFGWHPWDIVDRLYDLAWFVWYRGFATLDGFLYYVLLGAAIVLPLFILSRLISSRR